MRILIVGAGATGGYFGGRLVEAGRDITFLLRPARAAQLRERGLQLLSPLGNATLQPKILTAADLRAHPEPFDLVVLTTKAYQLAGAMDDVTPAVGPDTMLLPVLNGLRQIAVLTDRFGTARVLGGSVRIVADVDPEGRIEQRSTLCEISYGELGGGRSARLEAVDEAMRGAGFDALLQTDIFATLWQKWWILASIGAVCVLARGTVGAASSVPYGPELARAIVAECTAIATANGYPADPAMLASHLERLTDRSSTLTSSMYRDMLKGAPVEADHILGDLLARAGGVPAPLLTAAYVQLKVYEAGRPA